MHKNKKANGPNLESSPQGTRASQPIDKAKIQINSESAISKLENLKTKYANSKNFKGLLTDLRVACGIPNDENPSKYGRINIPSSNGKIMTCSLRLSNHHTNAKTYVEHDSNCDYNLSLAIRRRKIGGTFEPYPDVQLGHFAYPGYRLEQVENPLVKIIDGIIDYLQSGKYTDYTGVGQEFVSPSSITESNNNTNNMKRTIKLTESDLRRIITQAISEAKGDWKNSDSKYGYMYRNTHPYDVVYGYNDATGDTDSEYSDYYDDWDKRFNKPDNTTGYAQSFQRPDEWSKLKKGYPYDTMTNTRKKIEGISDWDKYDEYYGTPKPNKWFEYNYTDWDTYGDIGNNPNIKDTHGRLAMDAMRPSYKDEFPFNDDYSENDKVKSNLAKRNSLTPFDKDTYEKCLARKDWVPDELKKYDESLNRNLVNRITESIIRRLKR